MIETAWFRQCHREGDEREHGQADLFTVYKVKQSLDLEREQTAWRYINRYATETIHDDAIATIE